MVGEEDYALKIHIDAEGNYCVESGGYTTLAPRSGRLDDAQSNGLLDAVRELGIPRAHPMPAGSEAFEAHLQVGAAGERAKYVFWEGALESDPQLNKLVRLLERL